MAGNLGLVALFDAATRLNHVLRQADIDIKAAAEALGQVEKAQEDLTKVFAL